MDHFFRIVLCTCLCLGALQATPVRSNAAKQQCTIDKDDVLFELNNVLCENVTFSSPTNVKLDCHGNAVKHYIEQLTLADNNCNNTDYIMDSMDALDGCTVQPANCSLTLRSHNTFERFTSALEIFVEEFNYLRMK